MWLSLGWSTLSEQQWAAPLYWIERDGNWQEFSLGGLRGLNLDEPVCHVSYFEADAFARWSGARLPTEAEWERRYAARPHDGFVPGSFVESERYHPAARSTASSRSCSNVRRGLAMDGQPLRRLSRLCAAPGTLGEYNGKFMCNQYVLRGGSCAFPRQPPTSDLPQFLSARRAVAVHRSFVWLAT